MRKQQDRDNCPYFDKPMKDCYCAVFNSFTIPLIVRYCFNDYEECPHYKQVVLMSSKQKVPKE
ncbi:MAG: hypothetical protein DRH17_06745 [Deltaproteobacteria bacterium]|nr:MAG: hypothetical protein DRH17_06745 [Deltaproteobacteria bacterium]